MVTLHQADARALQLEDRSVHCVVTSPPYFGLRVYADNDDRGIGLEDSVEDYLNNLRAVFREVWRVLRDDGVAWVNIGESRADDTKWGGSTGGKHVRELHGATGIGRRRYTAGVQPGSRLGIPERLVLTLQDDGWTWRDTVVWAKKSAMPESIAGWRWEPCRVKVQSKTLGHQPGAAQFGRLDHTGSTFLGQTEWEPCPGCLKCRDNEGLVLRRGSWRTTASHEYIFMLTKGMGYYADGEPVKLEPTGGTHSRGPRPHALPKTESSRSSGVRANESWVTQTWGAVAAANRRSVWSDIAPEPYGGPHYATFPSDLPRLCIQASTSERGCCSECGAQWARVVESRPTGETQKMADGWDTGAGAHGNIHRNGREKGEPGIPVMERVTVGWRPTCGHDAGPVPCTVLDPFCGAGTTAVAAQRLGRRAIGVDLSEDYLQQAVKRLTAVPLPLVRDVTLYAKR